jgi:putative glutamine amidotransferase
MTAPLIGLTTFHTFSKYGLPQASLTEAYIQAIQRAGGAPLLIPLGLPPETLDEIAGRLDGIVFTGGGDVRPERYGNLMHPLVNEVDPDRDEVEIHLLETCLDEKLPFLGICRGIQVINVAMGGTLYEDILDQHPGAMRHSYFPEYPRQHRAHPVEIVPGSRLAAILGAASLPVNSMHHQGLARLANGIQASACAPDGIVEAFELPSHPFGIAVQWHPEWMNDDDSMDNLFQEFIRAAGRTSR